METYNRRNFLKTSLIAGIGAACVNSFKPVALPGKGKAEQQYATQVSLTTGNNRADMVFRALKPYSGKIADAIGKKRVVLKPNNVLIDVPLTSTHVDTLEGVLEFLKSIGKSGNVIIAESPSDGSALEGFWNYGYYTLISKYGVKLQDLDKEPSTILYVIDEKDFKPHPIRISSLLLDRDSFVVSVARMKTHDCVVATLSLKNIVLGAPVKDPDFNSKPSGKSRPKSDKRIAHGSGIRALNYNLYALSQKLHPQLAVIDGFEGMEGNGPNHGTPVDHRICVASTDWLAADRVATELMGIDFAKVGYLNYCARSGYGIADLGRIEITGERISDHKKFYKLHDNINDQLIWMKPVS